MKLRKLVDEMTEQGITQVGGFEIRDLNMSIKERWRKPSAITGQTLPITPN